MSRSCLQPRALARGFTLVELIVVIVILGVLAAVALPRFTNMQREARVAKVNAFAGSMRTAATLAKSTSLAQGTACDADVTMEGTAIKMINCYPTPFYDGIVAAANLNPVNDDVSLSYTNGPPRVFRVRINGARLAQECQVTYAGAVGPNERPTIAVATSGC